MPSTRNSLLQNAGSSLDTISSVSSDTVHTFKCLSLQRPLGVGWQYCWFLSYEWKVMKRDLVAEAEGLDSLSLCSSILPGFPMLLKNTSHPQLWRRRSSQNLCQCPFLAGWQVGARTDTDYLAPEVLGVLDKSACLSQRKSLTTLDSAVGVPNFSGLVSDSWGLLWSTAFLMAAS